MKKVFRFYGKIKKKGFVMKFKKEIIALDKEKALEKLYSILGSNHKAKRKQIIIEKVEIVKPEESENLYIKQLEQLIKEGEFR